MNGGKMIAGIGTYEQGRTAKRWGGAGPAPAKCCLTHFPASYGRNTEDTGRVDWHDATASNR